MWLTERLAAFKNHHLVRRTVTLQIGGVLGTLVQAVAGVVLARLLQPERFGQYALAFSVASIASIFIGGALTDAITPAVSRAWAHGDAERIRAVAGFFVRFVSTCAMATLVLMAALPFITAHLYHNIRIGGYADIIVAASIISTSVFSLTQLFAQVSGRFRTLMALTLADIVARYGAMLTLTAAGLGIWGAMAGHLIGATIMFGVAAVVFGWLELRSTLMPRFTRLIALARAASWQPLLKPTLWVLADSNFALLYGALPVALVGLYEAGAPLAYFKLAFGYLILSMSAMGPVSTVMNVHFPTVQTTAPDQLRGQFIRVTLAATALSATITAVVLAIAPVVFRFLYGTTYLPAVRYVYEFGVFGALFGLGVGLGPLWRSLGRVPTSIAINCVVLGLGIPLGLWLIAHWGITGAVVMVTAWYTISHAVSFTYLVHVLPRGRESATIQRHG